MFINYKTSTKTKIKLLATEFKPQRFEFFTAYSNALVDFQEQLEQNQQRQSEPDIQNVNFIF